MTYFLAWGETEVKDFYDSTTYIHCDGLASTSLNLGENIAETEYDVAHVKWGDNWKMPTIEDVKELFDNCNIERIELIGVYGIRFISRTNGNEILLPAGGFRFDPVPVAHDYGLNGYY